MANDVTNGKGGELTVNTTLTNVTLIVPVVGQDGSQKSAMTCKVWNTGSVTVFASVNEDSQVQANAVPIPSGESFWFVGQPMKKLIVTCAAATTTASYGAF
jgi:hypothetical protein